MGVGTLWTTVPRGTREVGIYILVPSRELTYLTMGKPENHLQTCLWMGHDPRRVRIPILWEGKFYQLIVKALLWYYLTSSIGEAPTRTWGWSVVPY